MCQHLTKRVEKKICSVSICTLIFSRKHSNQLRVVTKRKQISLGMKSHKDCRVEDATLVDWFDRSVRARIGWDREKKTSFPYNLLVYLLHWSVMFLPFSLVHPFHVDVFLFSFHFVMNLFVFNEFSNQRFDLFAWKTYRGEVVTNDVYCIECLRYVDYEDEEE